MLVRVIYKDGSEDIKEVNSVDEICLDNVESLKVIGQSLRAA